MRLKRRRHVDGAACRDDQVTTKRADNRIIGAAPAGARDEAAAADAVREMFTSIAPRYDLLNHVLSMNVDRLWWNRTARAFAEVLRRPEAQVLDLCCGTGDMAFALYRRLRGAPTRIIGADFSHAMLVRAEQKSAGKNLRWVEADALNLPFARRPVPVGDLGLRISQSRQLRSRTGGNLPRAGAREAKSASSISASPRA